MRTTLALYDDAIKLARARARRRNITLGQAVSELILCGARQPVPTTEQSGLSVVRLPPRSPRVTAAAVDHLVEEVP